MGVFFASKLTSLGESVNGVIVIGSLECGHGMR